MNVLVDAFVVVTAFLTLLVKVWAFIDASRFSREQYRYTDKMPRLPWLFALGAAVVLQIWLGGFRPEEPFGPRSLTWLGGLLLVLVYAWDMRPRLVEARTAGV